MRISTSSMYDMTSMALHNREADLNASYERLVSQERISVPSDDPYGAARLVDLDREKADAGQLTQTRGTLQTQLSLQESALGDANSALQNIRTTLVAAANGTNTDKDLTSYAQSIEGNLQTLLSASQARDGNGNYIFSGFRSEKPPFDAQGAAYQGSAENMMYKIDQSRNVEGPATADRIFTTGGKDGKNLFGEIQNIIKALKTPAADRDPNQKLADVIGQGMRTVDAGSDNILSVRAEGGTRLNEIEALNAQSSVRGVALQDEINGLRNTDFAKSMTDFTNYKVAYDATVKATSLMNKTSLFDML